jgi:DNA polymerase III alpha subunit
MIDNVTRKVDAWGRIIVDSSALVDLIYDGVDITTLLVESNEETAAFNDLCKKFDKADSVLRTPEPLDIDPADFHAEKSSTWAISKDIQELDVRSLLLSLCSSETATARVNMEMDMFEERGLIPLLQLMVYLVDHFRQNKIVWGVGRGSSVSSYCLYLIGVHKIDSIQYDLDINDFLK